MLVCNYLNEHAKCWRVYLDNNSSSVWLEGIQLCPCGIDNNFRYNIIDINHFYKLKRSYWALRVIGVDKVKINVSL